MDGVVLLYEICQGNKSRQICRSFLVMMNFIDGEQKTLPAARRPALFAIAEGEGEQPMRLCLACRISSFATRFYKRQ